jgi:hypothetical protein
VVEMVEQNPEWKSGSLSSAGKEGEKQGSGSGVGGTGRKEEGPHNWQRWFGQQSTGPGGPVPVVLVSLYLPEVAKARQWP